MVYCPTGKLIAGALLVWTAPQVAAIDCRDCSKRLYDLETGKPKSYLRGPDRIETFYEGEKHAPACLKGVKCPKGTIHTAKDVEPTWRNLKCLNAWRRFRAAPVPVDRIARDNFAILSELWELVQQRKLSGRIVDSFMPFLRSQYGA